MVQGAQTVDPLSPVAEGACEPGTILTTLSTCSTPRWTTPALRNLFGILSRNFLPAVRLQRFRRRSPFACHRLVRMIALGSLFLFMPDAARLMSCHAAKDEFYLRCDGRDVTRGGARTVDKTWSRPPERRLRIDNAIASSRSSRTGNPASPSSARMCLAMTESRVVWVSRQRKSGVPAAHAVDEDVERVQHAVDVERRWLAPGRRQNRSRPGKRASTWSGIQGYR